MKQTPVEARPEVRVSQPIPMAPTETATQKMAPPRRLTKVGGDFPPPGPNRPAAVLDGIGGVIQGQRYDVDTEVFNIGAAVNNDLVITGDEYISAHHAYLRYEKGSLFILDMGSRNGTFVNGERLAGATQVLMPGDLIKIGGCTFVVGIAQSV
jgi:hypothetical protein